MIKKQRIKDSSFTPGRKHASSLNEEQLREPTALYRGASPEDMHGFTTLCGSEYYNILGYTSNALVKRIK